MDERQMQFRVGAVVLATFVIGGLLVALNSPAPQSWVPWAKGKYRVLIELNQAPGIAPNTPVRKNGILIGRVSAIDDRENQVMVTAKSRRRSAALSRSALFLPGTHFRFGRFDH